MRHHAFRLPNLALLGLFLVTLTPGLRPAAAARRKPDAPTRATATPAAAPLAATARPEVVLKKQAAVASVTSHEADLVDLADQVWRFAETALRETRSSKVLADYAEKQGFRVKRGVAGMPTAFVAEYGQGSPVVGILGEFDALPGLSQKVATSREPLEPGAAGHGCGHNLFGAGSLGAAVAIKELIARGDLSGTIRFYGTPAEEAVGGKIYMLREGLLNDLDVCLAWHPEDTIRADTRSSQAIIDFIVEFHGKASHAAFDPWNGRSALDGLEIFTHALNMLREHVKPGVRMHYVITDGGKVPNVVPDYAKLWCWVRDTKRTGVEDVMRRVRKIVEGAALAADVTSTLTVQGGSYEMLANVAGERILHANLDWLGPLVFNQEEQEFARAIQSATGVEPKGLTSAAEPLDEKPGEPEGGSTDVGDVSWVIPTIHLSVTTAAAGAPWHSWPVVATGGMSIGHKGMIYAARALAATMVDLYTDKAALKAVREEFAEKTRGQIYRPYIPDGPPPLPTP
jgi:aminobenzoyl-glutamate utilization protein B